MLDRALIWGVGAYNMQNIGIRVGLGKRREDFDPNPKKDSCSSSYIDTYRTCSISGYITRVRTFLYAWLTSFLVRSFLRGSCQLACHMRSEKRGGEEMKHKKFRSWRMGRAQWFSGVSALLMITIIAWRMYMDCIFEKYHVSYSILLVKLFKPWSGYENIHSEKKL